MFPQSKDFIYVYIYVCTCIYFLKSSIAILALYGIVFYPSGEITGLVQSVF